MDDALPCGCGINNACEQCREIYECMTCSVQPGSPTLCRTCYGRRSVAGPRWMGPRPNYRAERAHPRNARASIAAPHTVARGGCDVCRGRSGGCIACGAGIDNTPEIKARAHGIVRSYAGEMSDDRPPRLRHCADPSCAGEPLWQWTGNGIALAVCKTHFDALDMSTRLVGTNEPTRYGCIDGCGVDVFYDAANPKWMKCGCVDRGGLVAQTTSAPDVPAPPATGFAGTLVFAEKRYPISNEFSVDFGNIVLGKRSVIGSAFVRILVPPRGDDGYGSTIPGATMSPGYTPTSVGYDDQSGDDL